MKRSIVRTNRSWFADTAPQFCMCLVFSVCVALGQVVKAGVDTLIIPQGTTVVSMMSGIPFLGVAEVAVGITDGFTVGAFFGISPIEVACGVRIRGLLYSAADKSFRVTARIPILLYPDSPGHSQPWWLAWPVVSSEFKLSNSVAIAAEAGVIASITSVRLENVIMGSHNRYERKVDHMGSKEGVYTTFGSTASLALSNGVALQGSFHVVMDGTNLAPSDWVGQVPYVCSIGVAMEM